MLIGKLDFNSSLAKLTSKNFKAFYKKQKLEKETGKTAEEVYKMLKSSKK